MKRIISFFLAFSIILFSLSYKPQRTQAFVAESAIIASVAVILTSIGITYWASSQSDASDYLERKLQDYFDTLSSPPLNYEEWLDIYSTESAFRNLGNGILRFGSSVANKILAFARWLQADESITSGGQAVGDFEKLYYVRNTAPYGDFFLMESDGIFNLSISNFHRISPSDSYAYIYLPLSQLSGSLTFTSLGIFPGDYKPSYWRLGATNDTSSWFSGFGGGNSSFDAGTSRSGSWDNKSFLVIQLNAPRVSAGQYSGEWQFRTDAPIGQLYDGTLIIPSSDVIVPSDLDDGFALSVYTNADIDSSDSVEVATQAIFDKITDAGLSSDASPVEAAPTAWLWLDNLIGDISDILSDIYQTVIGIPSAISQGVSDILSGIGSSISSALQAAFVPSEEFIDSFVASLGSNWDNHFSILSYPFSILGEFITLVSTHRGNHIFTWGNIKEPFSGKVLIAAGSYDLDDALNDDNFAHLYSIYMIVIKGYISFAFLHFLFEWFCDVFHMKDDDFEPPSLSNDYGEDWYS